MSKSYRSLDHGGPSWAGVILGAVLGLLMLGAAATPSTAEVAAPPQYWRSQPSGQKALFGPTPFGAR